MNLFRLAVGTVLRELNTVAVLGVAVIDNMYIRIEYSSPEEFHNLVWVTPLGPGDEPPLVELRSTVRGAWRYAEHMTLHQNTWSP